ncbi:UDP-glucose dehydrogenase UdgA [Mycobacterium tuberculosis]|nr:UDP-glucose dehydrogenase UdgA [Mycobacterium tuberculosis]
MYDPKALDNARRQFPTLNYAVTVAEACEGADAVLVLTEWQEFIDLAPGDLAERVRARVIVDGRNCLDARLWQAAGWRVFRLGAPLP